MNCFHFSVSLGYNTTVWIFKFSAIWLWIAFIFQYLWDTTQPMINCGISIPCCELLSFFSIFGIQHNFQPQEERTLFVVNCFHFSVSLGYNTTLRSWSHTSFLLWIAFIFQYLWDTTQPNISFTTPTYRCELLSFFSIFGIQHNEVEQGDDVTFVVNCFHFSVSLGYNTT